MITASGARLDFNDIVNNHGEKIRFKYYNVSGATTDYDDGIALSLSGAAYWASGLVQPVGTGKNASYEAVLLEQGKLLNSDVKIFIDGTINTSGTFKVGLGSPSFREYALTADGVSAHNVNGEIVYKKLVMRYLHTGSLQGE